jgi:hypothetical protein
MGTQGLREEKGGGLAGGRKIYHGIKIRNSNLSKKVLQKTRLRSGFKNPNKKIREMKKTRVDSSLFMNSIL